MNAVERAARDILFVLVMEANRQTADIPDLRDLKSKYSLNVPDILLDSSINPWDERDLLIVARTFDGTGACIKPGKYGPAVSELLQAINGTEFEVNWIKEEIVTDAPNDPSWPGLPGWKIWHTDGEGPPNRLPEGDASNHFLSSNWTGLSSNFELTEEKRGVLVSLLQDAELALDTIGVSNSERAMARAYIVAAKVLADAPEPPVDLIWELIGRANALSGIASLFVSIIALFSTVAH